MNTIESFYFLYKKMYNYSQLLDGPTIPKRDFYYMLFFFFGIYFRHAFSFFDCFNLFGQYKTIYNLCQYIFHKKGLPQAVPYVKLNYKIHNSKYYMTYSKYCNRNNRYVIPSINSKKQECQTWWYG